LTTHHSPLTITVRSLNDWGVVAEKILNQFPSKKIFALYGEMGTGKTTLVKSFCKILGVKEDAVSPTFSLVNEYSANSPAVSQKGHGDTIYHFDLYRLKNSEELIDIGFEEYLESEAYCFIEWPDMAEPFLPNDMLKIEIKLLEGEERIVIVF